MDIFRTIAPYMRARFGNTERGAALVEYALLLALIAVVCIVALTTLGNKASSKFNAVGNSLGYAALLHIRLPGQRRERASGPAPFSFCRRLAWLLGPGGEPRSSNYSISLHDALPICRYLNYKQPPREWGPRS